MENSILGDGLLNNQEELQKKKDEFCKRNEEASANHCHTVLQDLSQELEVGISTNVYAVPGGYRCFQEKLNEMVEKYRLVPGKGIQAEKSLEEFLKSKETISKTILQMDNALTDREKEIEGEDMAKFCTFWIIRIADEIMPRVWAIDKNHPQASMGIYVLHNIYGEGPASAERARTEAAEQQQRVMEQDQARMKEMIADQERSHTEQIQQLNEKMEADKQKLQEETARTLENKLKNSNMDLYFGFVVLEGLLAVAIITMNLLVCATVYLHKELRCVTNYLIVCLAVADLGVGALAIPFSMVLSMEYTLCFYTCLFLTCFPLVTTQFSILLLLLIAINAHLKIKLPNRQVKGYSSSIWCRGNHSHDIHKLPSLNSYARHVRKGWVVIIAVCCWLLSLLIGLSPMMGWNGFQHYVEAQNQTMAVSFPSERSAFVIIARDLPYGGFLSKVYPSQRQHFNYSQLHLGHVGRCSFTSIFSPEYLVYFIFLTCTMLPLAAMLGIYADLFRVVRGHFHRLWPAKKREMQMARTLFLLVGIFCVCWLPLHVLYCIQLLCPRCKRYESLDRLAVLLSHLNSLANPLVYALRKKDFGLALRSVFLHRVLGWPRLKACCCPSAQVHPQ
ncbi:hypothetical protein lerEdw1_009973 [Lerista edwardsae]|nr:hypothetical protein lerEdw1_009973 [Lerista edwardsae]